MSHEDKPADDPDPAPLKNVDAERPSKPSDGDSAASIEKDPAHDPPDKPLRDVKGG